MKRFNNIKKLNCRALVKVILLCGTLLLYSCKKDMDKYNNLIVELKKNNHETNKFYYYKIADFNNLETLIESNGNEPRDESLGTITLIKTENNLMVFIATTYKSHSGGKGLVYSENGEVPDWNEDEWYLGWTIDTQISKNWWNLVYND